MVIVLLWKCVSIRGYSNGCYKHRPASNVQQPIICSYFIKTKVIFRCPDVPKISESNLKVWILLKSFLLFQKLSFHCNGTRTHNHLVGKRTLNHLDKNHLALFTLLGPILVSTCRYWPIKFQIFGDQTINSPYIYVPKHQTKNNLHSRADSAVSRICEDMNWREPEIYYIWLRYNLVRILVILLQLYQLSVMAILNALKRICT